MRQRVKRFPWENNWVHTVCGKMVTHNAAEARAMQFHQDHCPRCGMRFAFGSIEYRVERWVWEGRRFLFWVRGQWRRENVLEVTA